MHTYILCNTSVTVWVQAAAKSGASQIDASEEQKRAKAERAEAKAKAAAAKLVFVLTKAFAQICPELSGVVRSCPESSRLAESQVHREQSCLGTLASRSE